ncbi:MAG: NHL repeat-containing protein [Ignavibacteriales bacterium]|nr:NHL repeat-containing protein [Ignavibacteriales bacterium]
MKLKHYLLILLFTAIKLVSAQNLVSFGQIGAFNAASSFSINPAGFIYVSDPGKNEIIKLDTLGKIIKSIGGYGWGESSFDDPIDVYANTLNVYVSDKNNNRIQMFDKDLNFLSQFSTQNSNDDRNAFRYPTGSAVSTQGDLFIFDSDNNRILKYNMKGEFQLTIGGFDAGAYSLSSPKQFAVTRNKILVVDANWLVVFDQFGNGIKKINLEIIPENINASFQNITVNDKSHIILFYESNLETGNFNPITFKPNIDEEIVDTLVFNNKLYLLTKNSIFIFNIILKD